MLRPSRPLKKDRQTRPHGVDEVVWEKIWTACGRKQLFETLADAETFLRDEAWEQVPYLCPSGDGHWHLTKQRTYG